MQRAVTAIYRSHAVATLVRDELEQLGIDRHAVTIIPENDRELDPASTGVPRTAVATTGGAFVAGAPFSGAAFPVGTYVDTTYMVAPYVDAFDRLHDLHLPHDDTRIYQQAIRNGDYILSAEVDEEADTARIQEIMRRPEDAYDLNELDARYSNAHFAPRGRPLKESHDEGTMGRRDENQSSPYSRYYIRHRPL